MGDVAMIFSHVKSSPVKSSPAEPLNHHRPRLAKASAPRHGSPRQMTRGAAEVRLPPGGTAQEAALRHVAVAEDVVEEGEANTT